VVSGQPAVYHRRTLRQTGLANRFRHPSRIAVATSIEFNGNPAAGSAGSPCSEVQRLSRRISLALTLHNHQPVGNFGWVIAETFERAYLPMVDALERHPGVRVALHYTGPL